MTEQDPMAPDLRWLTAFGLAAGDLSALNPCVPGEFTMPAAIYVNSGSPGVIYQGSEEGTLPMVAGRWYLIPAGIADRAPRLRREMHSPARARRLIG